MFLKAKNTWQQGFNDYQKIYGIHFRPQIDVFIFKNLIIIIFYMFNILIWNNNKKIKAQQGIWEKYDDHNPIRNMGDAHKYYDAAFSLLYITTSKSCFFDTHPRHSTFPIFSAFDLGKDRHLIKEILSSYSRLRNLIFFDFL